MDALEKIYQKERTQIVKLLKRQKLLGIPSSQWPALARFIQKYAENRLTRERVAAFKAYGGNW